MNTELRQHIALAERQVGGAVRAAASDAPSEGSVYKVFICPEGNGSGRVSVHTLNGRTQTWTLDNNAGMVLTLRNGSGPMDCRGVSCNVVPLLYGTGSVTETVHIGPKSGTVSVTGAGGTHSITIDFNTGLKRDSNGSIDQCKQPHS